VQLTHLHEPAIVHCLEARYEVDKIYTYTGSILLALNPFKKCADLYSSDAMAKYMSGEKDVPPHVYAVADTAFKIMMRCMDGEEERVDQSILVSGESGAGKTVTTRIVMRYLAMLSKRSAGGGEGSGGIEQRGGSF